MSLLHMGTWIGYWVTKEGAWLRFLWGAYPRIYVIQKYWSSLRDSVQRKLTHMWRENMLWAKLASNMVRDLVHLVWLEDTRDDTNPTDSSILPPSPWFWPFSEHGWRSEPQGYLRRELQLRENSKCKGPGVIASYLLPPLLFLWALTLQLSFYFWKVLGWLFTHWLDMSF